MLDLFGRFPYLFHVEHAGDLAEYLIQAAQSISIPINQHQSRQFVEFAQALQEWNRTVNLTAIDDFREVVVKHFVDSIVPLRFGLVSHETSILDIGTGAGFPSVPLKIMRSDLRPVLLEPNSKKVSFLLHLVGTLKLDQVKVVNQTLKEFAGNAPDQFDLVLVRALSLATLGEHVVDLLTSGGTLLAYRSARMESSDMPPGLSLRNEWSYELPFGYGRRVLVAMGAAHCDVPRGTRRSA
jgi:16S rRNA (guanine527-N7)-methyltransferase